MSSHAPLERRRVTFSGRVQGVGFRWTTNRIAKRHPEVRGYVRNLSDGTVELVAEANSPLIDAFVTEIQSSMSGNIEDCSSEQIAVTEPFSDFSIRR